MAAQMKQNPSQNTRGSQGGSQVAVEACGERMTVQGRKQPGGRQSPARKAA